MPRATWFNLDPAKRSRVVDAAMREFGTRGFSAGSLNVVARDGGVAKGSLFQYFEDKFDLFVHICDECSTRVRDHMVGWLEERDPDEPFFDTVRHALVEFVAYFDHHPVDRGMTFASNFEIDPQVRAAVRRVTNRHYLDVLRPLVKLAADRGELRPDAGHDQLLAFLLWVFPHVALAPHAPELDPVLGLYGRPADDVRGPAWGLVDAIERAFAVREGAP